VIGSLKSRLSKLEPPDKEYLTARDAIAEIEPEIRNAMKKGYTLEAIHERIKNEIPISKDTLKGYLYGKDAVNKESKPGKGSSRRKSA
jgi:hypothetical protein